MRDQERSDSLSRLQLTQGDITRERVDAIVNAANSRLRGGGGVDGAIHNSAGPELLDELIARHPEGCETGEVRATGGHRLRVKAILHAVGPVYQDGRSGEPELLALCHRNAMALAEDLGCMTIAFPAISCGVFGYPAAAAAAIALRTVRDELERRPAIALVRFVLFSPDMLKVFAMARAALRA